MRVVKSSSVPDASANFAITRGGVGEVEYEACIPPASFSRSPEARSMGEEEEEGSVWRRAEEVSAHHDGLSDELGFLNSLSKEALDAMGF